MVTAAAAVSTYKQNALTGALMWPYLLRRGYYYLNLALFFLACTCTCDATDASAPWMRSASAPTDRAKALLAVMNTSEKIAMLHGYSSPEFTGLTVGNKRLGIPPLNMNDGRQGFRPNDANNKQTAFPCELANVATFDKMLMRQFGEAMGEEFAGKGGNVMLAPMLILARVPRGGRNFESTGEDPELAYNFAYHMISGVQSVPGVIANADDFVLNNQETDRGSISAVADQRTLFELYYVRSRTTPARPTTTPFKKNLTQTPQSPKP
jgi:beta-glucosidase